MSRVLCVIEDNALPAQLNHRLELRDRVRLYLLDDHVDQKRHMLRATVVRPARAPTPPGARAVLELELVAAESGEAAEITWIISPSSAEVLRRDERGETAPLAQGQVLPDNVLLSLRPIGGRPVEVSLVWVVEGAQGLSPFQQSGNARRSWTVSSADQSFWMAQTVAGSLATPKGRVVAWGTRQAQRLGLKPTLFAPLLLLIATAGSLAWVAWDQHKDAGAARQEADQAKQKLADAEQARVASLSAEQSCLAQREKQAEILDGERAAHRIAVERALQLTLTSTLAIDRGAGAMGSELVEKRDGATRGPLLDALVDEVLRLKGEDLQSAQRCIDQSAALGPDLPTYVLLWHADPALVCPASWREPLEGVDRAGPLGLSARAAAELGVAAEGTEGAGDPRASERWAAATLGRGLRLVTDQLVAQDIGGRPAVLPGQAHLWALAIWDGLNRMAPAPAPADPSITACVAPLLVDLGAMAGASEPGQAVLPDILAAANGQAPKPTPTVACPWPPDALVAGPRAALRAAARAAVFAEQTERDSAVAASGDGG